jgi:hypothetical protein
MDQEIQFLTAQDGARIAYATVGEGPPLVKAANYLSHLEFDWGNPVWQHWLEGLTKYNTLIAMPQKSLGRNWTKNDFMANYGPKPIMRRCYENPKRIIPASNKSVHL